MKATLMLGKGITRAVDLTEFGFGQSDHAVGLHIFTKGLENVVKDTHAGITKRDNPNNFMELSESVVDKKLAALRSGDLRVARAPIDVEALGRRAAAKMSFEEFLAQKTPEEIAEFMANLPAGVETKKRKTA